MISQDDVKTRIEEIADKNFLKNVQEELNELHLHLFDDEVIEFIAQGLINNKNWLVTVTTKRVLLLYKFTSIQSIEIPKDWIKNVSTKKGVLLSELDIDKNGEIIKISYIQNDICQELQKSILCLVQGHQYQRPEQSKQTVPDKFKKRRRINSVTLSITILLFIGLFTFVYSPPGNKEKTVSQKVEIPKTAKQVKEEKIQAQFSGWSGEHRNLERIIKNSMNNPDSYEHVETIYRKTSNDTIIVSTKFRGTNAFGGVVLNGVVAEFDIDGNFIKIIKE